MNKELINQIKKMIEVIKEALFRIFMFILLAVFIPIIFLWLAFDIIILDKDGKQITQVINKWIKRK